MMKCIYRIDDKCAITTPGEVSPCSLCPRWSVLIDPAAMPTAEQFAAAEIERVLELRSAERRRCQYRSTEPVGTEPCACSTIRVQPIYHCRLHACECADLRQPQPPARFCGQCPDRMAFGNSADS